MGVWWDNGYYNGSVNIAFDFSSSSNRIHELTIPLYDYDGIIGDSDGYDNFSRNGYTLSITNTFNGNISCTVTKPNTEIVSYAPYINGNWTEYLLKIDVQNGTISFQGIEASNPRYSSGFSFMDYREVFEKVIFDISDNVQHMAIKQIYHNDTGTGDHPHFQVTATTTWLNTYGFVMVDPSLNIYTLFPDFNDLRLNLYSFAYYGDSMTINGHTFPMDGSIIGSFWILPKGSPIYDQDNQITGYVQEDTISQEGVRGAVELKPTLNNVYITWADSQSQEESDRVCYLTFVNDNRTVNMGTYAIGDMAISFGGVWYFTTAIYEPYTGYETKYTMDWDSPFNLDKGAFLLIFMSIVILCFLVMNVFYKPGLLDYAVVGLTGIIAYILL